MRVELHQFSFRGLSVSLFRCNLTTRLVLPGPWRGAEHEEKGAGSFLQDEWEHWLPKPKFSQQTLQVCALPRQFVHIKPAAAHMSRPLFVPHSSHRHSSTPAASLLIYLNRQRTFPPFGSFIVLVNIYVLTPVLRFFFWESVWWL